MFSSAPGRRKRRRRGDGGRAAGGRRRGAEHGHWRLNQIIDYQPVRCMDQPFGAWESVSEALVLCFYTSSRFATTIHRFAAMRCVLELFRHEWDFTTRSFAIEGSWCSFGRSKGNFFLFIDQPGSGSLSCGHDSTVWSLRSSPFGLVASLLRLCRFPTSNRTSLGFF